MAAVEPLAGETVARLRAHLTRIYGEQAAADTLPGLLSLLDGFRRRHPGAGRATPFDETDVVLISYGDQVRAPGEPTLATLHRFLRDHVGDAVTGLHLLPIHPWSSDDGFAVVDYAEVDPELGTWPHVTGLAADYRLMLDAVVNHTSASHEWFLRSQCGDPRYVDFYRYLDPGADLSAVTRPRTSPLLTRGWSEDEARRWVWTTFGPDQVDLNYAHPQVLLAVTGVLLDYLARGAGMLRLDAVAFLWKRLGTSCLHLPETHEIVRLWRTVVDAVAPGTLLVTETNVPHAENVSYLGDDQAHLVYQFPLPPLTLAAFHSGDASRLTEWAGGLEQPGGSATFLNFLGSHDGVGLRPVEGILPEAEVAELSAMVQRRGGLPSYREGTAVPYELNISYFDALSAPHAAESRRRQVDRFLAAQSILLAMAGVPAVYFHALVGSRSWPEGAAHTGRPRVINRQRLAWSTLAAELADPGSLPHQVLHRMRERIATRTAQAAFHPGAAQEMLAGDPRYVAVQRTPARGDTTVVCVHDVSGRPGRFRTRPPEATGKRLVDLVDGSEHAVEADGTVDVPVPAYGVRWLRARS